MKKASGRPDAFFHHKKIARSKDRAALSLLLQSAGNLTGTQATGAGVDPFGGTGHHRLDALDIGLPGTVGAAMGMGNLNAERHALTANIAFCQLLHLLVGQ